MSAILRTGREWLLAIACLATPAAAIDRRPNVLILMPDQLRAQALGCMGNPDAATPNLDRLAREGVLFRNAFANTPVCCPARADILTGKYAHRNGMVANDLRLRESETTLAELLAAAGYRTGFIGKWHLDGGKRLPGFVPPGPRRQGFQFWAANECSHAHFDTQYFRDGPEPIPVRRFEPEAWADLAVEFLRAERGRPFFLMVAMGPPHDPYGAPEEYMKRYDAARLAMRANWVEGVTGGGRREIAAYYAAVTAVDDAVGRILRELAALDVDGDTIVVVTSDHGDMLGSQGARLKRKPWEESIRVPGIVRYPRSARGGRTTDVFLTHVDLAPTLLRLCGLRPARGMQGADLSGVVLGRSSRGPQSAYFQIFGPYAGDGTAFAWRGVRTRRFMYARSEKEPWVLYDLEQDPYEQRNLAREPSAAPTRKQLEAALADWMKRTGDSWSFDWSAPVEDGGRLYRFETFYTVEQYLKWAAAHPEVPKN
jgi:arylsulfatase A-like enzyme